MRLLCGIAVFFLMWKSGSCRNEHVCARIFFTILNEIVCSGWRADPCPEKVLLLLLFVPHTLADACVQKGFAFNSNEVACAALFNGIIRLKREREREQSGYVHGVDLTINTMSMYRWWQVMASNSQVIRTVSLATVENSIAKAIEMCKGRKMATIECLKRTKVPWNWTRSFARWHLLQLLHVHDTSLQFRFYSLLLIHCLFFSYKIYRIFHLFIPFLSSAFFFPLLHGMNNRPSEMMCEAVNNNGVKRLEPKHSSHLIVFFTCTSASGVNRTSFIEHRMSGEEKKSNFIFITNLIRCRRRISI